MVENITKAEIDRFLSNFGPFELLEPQQIKVLARLVTPRRLGSNEILWLQGQQVTHFTIVYAGALRSVRRTAAGAEKLVSTLRSGQHFGLAEMITGATSAVTIIASRDSTLLSMGRGALRRELLSNAEISYRLMQTMARAIFSLTRELERASFENVPTRLARLLLKKVSPGRGPVGGSRGPRQLSHSDLALQVGVSRETVSRVLAGFKKKGLIETGYRSITVLNADGLMEYIEDYDQW